MGEVLIDVIRFAAGGALVCVFALVSEVWRPKRFAGIFSAAPSVLVAGLIVTLLTKGAASAQMTTEGAIAGAIGMVGYCLLATPAIRHLKALAGSGAVVAVWCLLSLGAYAAVGKVVGW